MDTTTGDRGEGLQQKRPFRLRGCSSSTVKMIALASMLVDHLAASGVLRCLYPSDTLYSVCRMAGRIAFPLFCFLLVEGHAHTTNQKRYLGRLLLFAFLSEIPFDLAFFGRICYLSGQNVFFTLFLGLLTLAGVERLRQSRYQSWTWTVMLAGMLLAEVMHTDYGAFGVVLILIYYWFRGRPWQRNLVSACACIIEPAAIAAVVPIQLYNGERGMSLKYFFYVFYPLHLSVLYLVREMIS